MFRVDVAVVTRDPRSLYRAVALLKQMDVSFAVCDQEDPALQNAQVILTDDVETSEQDPRTVIMNNDDQITMLEILLRLRGISTPSTIVIGVDPGMRFGLALVIDRAVILKHTAVSPPDAATTTKHWIKYLMSRFPMCRTMIRIGTGSKLFAVMYLREVSDVETALIEIVNECNTSVSVGPGADSSSAVLIANRTGRSVSGNDYVVSTRSGNLESIRRLHTYLTQGKGHLSNEDARAIVEGHKLLSDLLDEPD
ncbi:MAG: hypothetical protein QXS20_01045 [Candidatus Thorarchaeota archaeon]